MSENAINMFLYIPAYICEEAEKVCSEAVMPYMPSIIEALTKHIGGGILGMQDTLRTQMNSTFTLTNGKVEDIQKVNSCLSRPHLVS